MQAPSPGQPAAAEAVQRAWPVSPCLCLCPWGPADPCPSWAGDENSVAVKDPFARVTNLLRTMEAGHPPYGMRVCLLEREAPVECRDLQDRPASCTSGTRWHCAWPTHGSNCTKAIPELALGAACWAVRGQTVPTGLKQAVEGCCRSGDLARQQ